MELSGILYDGVTAQGYPARIFLESDSLKITYNKLDIPVEIFWDINRIHKSEFRSAQALILEYGDDPLQTINISEPQAYDLLRKIYPDASFLRSPYHRIFSFRAPAFFSIGIAVILFITIGYFKILPWAAERVAKKMPPRYEKMLGVQLLGKITTQFGIDSVRTQIVQNITDQLTFENDTKPVITVIKEKQANAFALPGGYIMICDSIFDVMKSPSELIALIGHEYAHCYFRHTTEAMVHSFASYMIFSILFGDASGISATIIQNSEALKSLQYSRELESQADTYALKLLLKNRADSKGMEELLNHLEQKKQSKFLEIFSTHPEIEARISTLEKLRKKWDGNSVIVNDSINSYWSQLKKVD